MRGAGLGASTATGWALSTASRVLLMMVHSAKIENELTTRKTFPKPQTFLKESFQRNCLVMWVAAHKIVRFRIIDHQTKISFKSKSIFVHASFQFCSHSTEIHRLFDDVEITKANISGVQR